MVPRAWSRPGRAGRGSGGPSSSSPRRRESSEPSRGFDLRSRAPGSRRRDADPDAAPGPDPRPHRSRPRPRPASIHTPPPRAMPRSRAMPSEPPRRAPLGSGPDRRVATPTSSAAIDRPPRLAPRPASRCRRASIGCASATASRASRSRSSCPTEFVAWSGQRMADVAAEVPVTRSTSFAIASVSKTFTAALILALAEDGRIDLDAPVAVPAPALKKISVKVTVRHLLDHTSGLRDYFFHPSIDQLLLSRPIAAGMRRRGAEVRRQGLLPSLAGLALLEHELPRARDARRGRRRRPWPTRCGRASSNRSSSTTPGTSHRRGPCVDVAHGYRFASASTDGSRDRPVRWHSARAVHVGRHRRRRRGRLRGEARTTSPAGRTACTEADPTPGIPRGHGRSVDDEALKSAIPYGYGAQVVEIDGLRTVGHSVACSASRSAVRYLPDQGCLDRRAHQPEPDRSRPRSSGLAPDRPDPGDRSCLPRAAPDQRRSA